MLQEILHRYAALGRRDAIQPAFDALLGTVDDVFPVTADNVTSARDILFGSPGLSARDAIHVAVMRQHGVEEILSFDRGFRRNSDRDDGTITNVASSRKTITTAAPGDGVELERAPAARPA